MTTSAPTRCAHQRVLAPASSYREWEGRAKACAALNEDLVIEANEKLDGLRGQRGNERLASSRLEQRFCIGALVVGVEGRDVIMSVVPPSP